MMDKEGRSGDVVYSWPESELRGTRVREQVHRLVQSRQAAQRVGDGA